jgi:sugar phosphate permease
VDTTNRTVDLRRRLQARTFGLTWLSYASYYATRKNFSVVKSRLDTDLHVGVAALGAIDTAYLVAYAAGQFLNGALGDRFGAKRMIGFGMLASAAACCAFGLGSTSSLFLLAFGLNGLAQATGWPNNVKTMGAWFERRVRGRVMGIWSTNYQVGGLLATAAATALLVHHGWRSAFFVPSIWVALVGGIVLLALVEKPADRGLSMEREPFVEPEPGSRPEGSPFGAMMRTPAVWILGTAYFGLKLIRYSLLFWLPFFLTRRLGYDEGSSGYMSTAFEAGGIAGCIAVGWLADRRFSANPIRLVVPVLAALAGALVLVRAAAPHGSAAIVGSLATVGFLLFGPDTLISGAAAQNLGRGRATASAAGIINGFGSVGAACQGMLTAYVSQRFGWDALFLVFVAVAAFSAIALVPLAWRARF